MGKECGIPVIARLPLDPLVARACDEGNNFLIQHAGTPAADAYSALATGELSPCAPLYI